MTRGDKGMYNGIHTGGKIYENGNFWDFREDGGKQTRVKSESD